MGKLVFNYGVMGSGKSAKLLLTADLYKRNNHKILQLKPRMTPTSHGMIKSRCRLFTRDVQLFEPNTNLTDLIGDKHEVSLIVIDEAHLLTKEQVLQLCEIADNNSTGIYCYGQKNLNGELYEGSKWMLVYADKLNEIEGLCWCGSSAMTTAILDKNGNLDRTFRWINEEDITVSLCRKHWMTGRVK